MPLRTGAVKMKLQTILSIFSNVDILQSISHELHTRLHAAYDRFPLLLIGELFTKSVNSLHVYTQYVNNFSNAIDNLEVERKRSKAFSQFLQVIFYLIINYLLLLIFDINLNLLFIYLFIYLILFYLIIY